MDSKKDASAEVYYCWVERLTIEAISGLSSKNVSPSTKKAHLVIAFFADARLRKIKDENRVVYDRLSAAGEMSGSEMMRCMLADRHVVELLMACARIIACGAGL